MDTQNKWTVIFLMDVPLSHSDNAKAMIEAILSLIKSEEVGVVMCIHCPKAFIQDLQPDFKFPKESTGDFTTCFCAVEVSEKNKVQKSKLTVLQEDDKFNIKNGQSVCQFFNEFVLSKYTASNYLLFTWGHGATYGIFFDGNFPTTPIGGPVLPQEFDMLTMENLKKAIDASFNVKQAKLSLVIMMNCFMQMIDTQLTLHAAGVELTVASENGMDFQGYNYRGIFRKLYSQPDMPPLELAEQTVALLNNKSFSQGRALKDSLENATIFATDLSQAAQLVEPINRLGVALLKEIQVNNNFDKVRNARQSFDQGFTGKYAVIDLFRFIENLQKQFGKEWEKNLLQDLFDHRQRMIVQEFIGQRSLRNFPPTFELGCAICFPFGIDINNIFYITYILHGDEGHNSSAAMLKDWNSFVKAFLDLDQ